MLVNRAYYLLKPVIPWGVRVALRRWRAERRRAVFRNVWPIDEKAGAMPANWPGWPENKRFAFVLTHDVEWAKGLGRIARVVELERKYGFRSSFNLIPEREYRVSDSLLHSLAESGFEVGVHGLKHDGKLYSSKAEFARRAKQIRHYLDAWNATGFRSPMMHHRLSWLHLLDLEYDASTFDTDPFEPEPDGVGTIFPFWVTGPGGDDGYVELPYTLVQDFTLFVVLREQTIDIWKKKVDWIAERGGMVLINVHPDYMSFENSKQPDEYPASYYAQFLAYVREKYDGAFWHALPREVARFYKRSMPATSRNSRKKVCMLTYSKYETDTRVRQYAEALARRGDQVDVLAITDSKGALGEENIAGVTVIRVQRREHNENGKWSYAWRLLRFCFCCAFTVARRHNRVRYDLIHAHNIPDFLIYAAAYPKWTGAKLILDIHDLVPEFFGNKFGGKARELYVPLLKAIEKASCLLADHVIIANDLWRETLVSRSVPRDKCSVVLNYVDPEIFYRRARTAKQNGRFVLVFPGSWQAHQGLDVAIDALAHLTHQIPGAELHLYGGGGGSGAQAKLVALANRLGVAEKVKFFGEVSLDQVADIMANADVGVVPKRADSFGNEAYSTKITEFMSQGLPVVASRTRIDTHYFNESVVRFFPSGDGPAMARAILELRENPEIRQSFINNGLEYVAANNWNTKKREYFQLVDSLTVERFATASETDPARSQLA